MKRKQWLALLLALMLGLSLCLTACGKKDSDAKGADDTKTEQTAAPKKTNPPEEEAEEEDEAWIADGLFLFGTVEGDVYENERLGIGCELKDWTFADSEKLAAINQFGLDTLDEDLKEALQSAQTVTEMYADHRNPTQNVVITVQNMKEVYGFTLEPEQMLDISLPQLPSLMEGAGYTEVNGEKETISFCGADHACLRVTAKIYGIDVYQLILPIASDEYMFVITFSSFGEDSVDDIVSLFYPL